jgi:ABC-type phosphate transport system substrate-binding protein
VFFKDMVLRRGDSQARDEFSPRTEWIEGTADIVTRVATDRDAISFVGLGFVDPSVKIVAISSSAGEPAVEPLARNVPGARLPRVHQASGRSTSVGSSTFGR